MDNEKNGGIDAVKSGGRIFIVMIVEGIVILILTIVLILVTVNRKASVVDGASSAYRLNDKGDNIVAMSVSCVNGDSRYSFSMDGFYEVYSEGDVIKLLERGEYTIDGTTVRLDPYGKDKKSHNVDYISNQLIVNGKTYECSKFEDVER